MANKTQEVKSGNRALESAIAKLRGLSNESQTAVVSIIDRLAEAEGVFPRAEFKPPLENIGHWLTKLRSERKSERTIRLYEYLVRRFLKQLPSPTRADLREYLARRIGETSTSSAEMERKALASLFSFLHSEGLWHENPLDGVKHIGPRWGESERKCPAVEDVEKVLEAGCLRAQDSLKMRTVIVLLATTVLRCFYMHMLFITCCQFISFPWSGRPEVACQGKAQITDVGKHFHQRRIGIVAKDGS